MRTQVSELIAGRNISALREPPFDGVSDERLLALFELAVRCTSIPTARRPNMIEVMAQLQAAVFEITGAPDPASALIDEQLARDAIVDVQSLEDLLSAVID